MTDKEMDAFLRKALLLSNSPKVMGLTNEPQSVSELFQKKMEKLMLNPQKVGKQGLWPLWRKMVHYVACAAIIITLIFSSVLAVSPTIREWVKNAVVEWFQEYTDFRFYGESTNEAAGGWRPQYLPLGYKEIEVNETEGYGTLVYEDEYGSVLYFDSREKGEGRQFNIDRTHNDMEEITLNGHPAYSFCANGDGWPNYLVWISGDEESVFLLTGEVAPNELKKIAESVKLMPET